MTPRSTELTLRPDGEFSSLTLSETVASRLGRGDIRVPVWPASKGSDQSLGAVEQAHKAFFPIARSTDIVISPEDPFFSCAIIVAEKNHNNHQIKRDETTAHYATEGVEAPLPKAQFGEMMKFRMQANSIQDKSVPGMQSGVYVCENSRTSSSIELVADGVHQPRSVLRIGQEHHLNRLSILNAQGAPRASVPNTHFGSHLLVHRAATGGACWHAVRLDFVAPTAVQNLRAIMGGAIACATMNGVDRLRTQLVW
jgi:hypothetical protein